MQRKKFEKVTDLYQGKFKEEIIEEIAKTKKILLLGHNGEKVTLIPKYYNYDVQDVCILRTMKIPAIGFNCIYKGNEEPYAIITKSFGEFIGYKNTAYIDLNNCPFATQLLELEIARETGATKQSGFCRYPLWEFDEKFLQAIGGQEYQDYLETYENYMVDVFGVDEEDEEEVENEQPTQKIE